MSYSILKTMTPREQTDRHSSYEIQDSYTYVVNALRRVMLSELTCAGVPNVYSKREQDRNTPGFVMHKNSGRLHNEFLSHRLSLLPIALNPVEIQNNTFV